MKNIVIATFCLFLSVATFAQSGYKLPPKEIVDIIDAPATPAVRVSPTKEAMLYINISTNPDIEILAQPILRIGGIRINPVQNSRQRTSQANGMSVQWLAENKSVTINIPAGSKIGSPAWSNDGKKIAFTRDTDLGVELWVADAKTGAAKKIANVLLNDVLGNPMQWMADNNSLMVRALVANRGKAPVAPLRPDGPVIDETDGVAAAVRTFQDLLKNQHDENLFEYFGKSQLVLVNSTNGTLKNIGTAALITGVNISPDENYMIVSQVKRPFSYLVTYTSFSQSTQIWDKSGRVIKTMTDMPVLDNVPIQGVVTGPRSITWQALHPAKLIWVEALDGGDPLAKAENRDKILTLSAPFNANATEVMKLKHRFGGFDWLANVDEIFISEFERERRWRYTTYFNLKDINGSKKVVFDLSTNDVYNNPGTPVYETNARGESVIAQDGDWIYLSGRGASPQGDFPEVNAMNIKTLEKKTIFKSKENTFEQFVAFAGTDRTNVITQYQSKTEVPNYHLVKLTDNSRKALTNFKDPAPQLTGISKQLVKYNRPDGVPLSGTLYLPANYKQGDKLPVFIWAYPLEYSDASTAGQVRGSDNTFTFFRGTSPLFFVTQGYAVLMDATMPIVGNPETMNDTFVEQIVASGRAAIDKLDEMGVIDRNKVIVGGHSYGAFMTASLLAHSNDYAAGIARSGAYNRTLTPFGFQGERRSFWDAKDMYLRVSPFTHANKIKKPILITHGEADNNSGTFPIQSERLFQAIKGNGGTARLVMLPHESHGYVARESVLHILAEMIEWADKHVKNKGTTASGK